MKLAIIKTLLRRLLSIIRVCYLRLRGAKIGKRVIIGKAKISISPKNLKIGDGVVIEDGVIIERTGRIEIGDYVKIKRNVIISGHLLEPGNLYIGENSWIGDETIVNTLMDVKIGKNVCIGVRTQIWTHGYFPSKADGYPYKYGEVIIEDGVWIQASCVLLPDVKIGEGAIIGTGSVVTKSLPPRHFCVGIPCEPKMAEEKYRKFYSPEEKLEIVMNGFVESWKKMGFRIRKFDGYFKAKFFLYSFYIIPLRGKIIETNRPRILLSISEKEDVPLKRNDTLVNLIKNTYTKKGTLAEFLFIRTLLDECILRIVPEGK
jgi:acetyltransferase-like isoleucine patch superfamily enzyme